MSNGAQTMGRDDFRSLRNFIRFANGGVLPGAAVAQRAAEMIDGFSVTAARTVIESIRSGVLPSQELCQAAEVEVIRLYELSEQEGALPMPQVN